VATKEDLCDWVQESIERRGGSATVVEVAEEIWSRHEKELWQSGRLFFTWQYDMRWCALELRKRGVLKQTSQSQTGSWEIAAA
jgi:hypothetical protein